MWVVMELYDVRAFTISIVLYMLVSTMHETYSTVCGIASHSHVKSLPYLWPPTPTWALSCACVDKCYVLYSISELGILKMMALRQKGCV